MRFYPHKLHAGPVILLLALWLAAEVCSAAVIPASQRYKDAWSAVDRMKTVLAGNRNPSREDLYYVNIQREVAIIQFRALIGDIKLQSYEGKILLETIDTLQRVPLYDRYTDVNTGLDFFGARVLAALSRVPETRDVLTALENLESRDGSCEAEAK